MKKSEKKGLEALLQSGAYKVGVGDNTGIVGNEEMDFFSSPHTAMACILGSATPSLCIERLMISAEKFGWKETLTQFFYTIPKAMTSKHGFILMQITRQVEEMYFQANPHHFVSTHGFDHFAETTIEAVGITKEEVNLIGTVAWNIMQYFKDGNITAAEIVLLALGTDLQRAYTLYGIAAFGQEMAVEKLGMLTDDAIPTIVAKTPTPEYIN